jgi:hypothetical protein
MDTAKFDLEVGKHQHEVERGNVDRASQHAQKSQENQKPPASKKDKK